MTTFTVPSRNIDPAELHSPRRHVPTIPDFRFEYSYLRSIRSLIHIERAELATDEKSRVGAEAEQLVLPRETISVQWARLLWITTRDQVLSPFLQGAAWGVLSVYLKPLMSSIGLGIRAWWARGARPRRNIEGDGASWLRTRLSNVTTPSSSSHFAVPK